MPCALAVEHDRTMLSLLEDALDFVGWCTSVCDGIENAVEAARCHKPDAVVIDLPGSGSEGDWDVLERLRCAHAPDRPAVIVLVNDSRERDDRREWLASRGITGLVKPFDLDDLYRALPQTVRPGEV